MKNNNFHCSGAKQKIDQAMNILYSGGLNNPMDAIELISYLIFLKILTDTDKKRAAMFKKYVSPFIKDFKECSWDYLLPLSGKELVRSVRHAIEKIHKLPQMSETGKMLFNKATLKITDPPPLKALVEVIDTLSNELVSGSDIQGDTYEYLLKKLSTSGTNGQFRTPRHIIDLIVKLVDPKIGDTICDPACGSAGFLIAAYNHILESNTSTEAFEISPIIYGDRLTPKQWNFLDEKAIWGLDNDTNMVKIAALNVYLHGLPKAKISYHNTLTAALKGGYSSQKFSVILANPPFAGTFQEKSIQEDLSELDSRSTELLFLKWIIDHLENHGRAGVIVPNGVLYGSSKGHIYIRKSLLEKCNLQGVISLPCGVFKPYAGVATSILIFEKGKTTEHVWFYELAADGFSLDDKRNVIKENDIPDILENWTDKKKTIKSLFVDIKDIKENDWCLSLNRYQKRTFHEEQRFTNTPHPRKILNQVAYIQTSIQMQVAYLQKIISL